MAVSKDQLIEFYSECLAKAYTDMSDDVQALKAKVIAMDLNIKYKSISDLYDKAKKAYEENQQESERLSVKGDEILSAYGSKDSIKVFRRPDGSVYCELFYGKDSLNGTVIRAEGLPDVFSRKSGTFSYEFHPSETIFTGASTGGVFIGGTHQTKAYTEEKFRQTNKGCLIFKKGDFEMEAQSIRIPEEIANLFKRNEIVVKYAQNNRIVLFNEQSFTDQASLMLKYSEGNTDSKISSLSTYADEARSSLEKINEVLSLIIKIFKEEYPQSDETVYKSAVELLNTSTDSTRLDLAAKKFSSILGFKDSSELLEQAKVKYAEVLQKEKEAEVLRREKAVKKNKKGIIIAIPVVIVIVALIVLLIKVIIPENKYGKAAQYIADGAYDEAIALFQELGSYKDSANRLLETKYSKAVFLLESKKYDDAISEFIKLGDYMDSKDKINECRLTEAENLIASGDYVRAYNILEILGRQDIIKDNKYGRAIDLINSGRYDEAVELLDDLDYKDSEALITTARYYGEIEQLSRAVVGSTISFGGYYQEQNYKKTPILWQVLEREENRILVISTKAIDCRPYDNGHDAFTYNLYNKWSSCSLREWLNDSFINEAFGKEEQEKILSTIIQPDKNPDYNTDPGFATEDKIFILSFTEINKYFTTNKSRLLQLTDYALKSYKYTNLYRDSGYVCWWVRNPGEPTKANNKVSFVYDSGTENTFGYDYWDKIGVRPAMWISLE